MNLCNITIKLVHMDDIKLKYYLIYFKLVVILTTSNICLLFKGVSEWAI